MSILISENIIGTVFKVHSGKEERGLQLSFNGVLVTGSLSKIWAFDSKIVFASLNVIHL